MKRAQTGPHGHALPTGKKIATTHDSLETELRNCLAASELALRALEKETGISKTHLANFKNSARHLSFQNMDRLARYFGIKYSLKNF